MGVTTYTSAMFNFVLSFATDFYRAVRAQDRDEVYRRPRSFVLPYLDIRNRNRNRNRNTAYAVSIVKAGLTAVGRPASPVRPPLSELTATS